MRYPPPPQANWPESWRLSYQYDVMEVFKWARPKTGHAMGYTRAYKERFERTLAAVVKYEPIMGASVLDIAGAQGNFSLTLAEHHYKVTWNDLRSDLIGYVQQKHLWGDVSYAPGNAFELPFAEPFDVVLATEIIEHVAHPDRFLRQLSQLVRPGGVIILTTPNGSYFRNRLPKYSETRAPEQFEAGQFKPDADGHIFLLHPDEIHRLAMQNHLTVEDIQCFTNPLTRGALRLDRILPVVPGFVVTLLERFTSMKQGIPFQRFNLQMLAVLRKPRV